MKQLLRLTSILLLGAFLALPTVGRAQVLKVLQKFTHEGYIGDKDNIVFADVNGDGHPDMIAKYWDKVAKSYVGGVWLWKGGKFSDSVDCEINLGFTGKECWLTAGDFNGDGMADIAFLSQYSSYGAPKVVYGRKTWPKSITTPDLVCQYAVDSSFVMQGQYGSLACGDFNGDGYKDLVMTLQGNDTSGAYNGAYGGRVVVYFGSATGLDSIPGWEYKGGHSYQITGTNNHIIPRYFSPWHIGVGDFNGDGTDDIFIAGWNAYTDIVLTNIAGNAQSVYNCGCGLVFLGGSQFPTDSVPSVILLPPDNFLKYTTPTQYLWLGYSVFNAGDMNGDGTDDFVLPGWYMDQAFVFPGSKSYHPAYADSTVLVARNPIYYYTKNRFNMDAYQDQLGVDLIPIGDVNRDGSPDLALARNFWGTNTDNPGARFFFTKASAPFNLNSDYETPDYTAIWPVHFDYNGTGESDIAARVDDSNLVILSVSPITVTNVADVPGDQGGKVKVTWTSTVDNNVTNYPYFSIWRALPSDAVTSNSFVSPGSITLNHSGKTYTKYTVNSTPYAWEWLGNQPAALMSTYSYTAQTLNDTGMGINAMEYFMVIAHTSDANKFYVSNIDSGFSVDNIPPGMPGGFAGSAVKGYAQLKWAPNTEKDLYRYLIYRSNTGTFSNTLAPIANVTDTTFTDNLPLTSSLTYYAVSAEDVHGNISPKTPAVAMNITGVDQNNSGSIPAVYYLDQNYPNPFNPTTTISYGLPKAGYVTLRVINDLGQEVASLVNVYQQAGRYQAGTRCKPSC